MLNIVCSQFFYNYKLIMSLNFLIFFTYYFLILLSILGYGWFLLSFEKNNKNYFKLGYVGIVGIFFLILYSYLSNIFIAHSKIHNTIFILVGLLIFIYHFKKNSKKKDLIKHFKATTVIFLILFISLLIEKNHDDFPYYHFSYTYQLTQDSLGFGIGKLNHGFRTPSSIFYLNSLFYLPLAEYYLFNFSAVFIFGFANVILLEKIMLFKDQKKINVDFVNYLSLLSLVFINIFFYRIAEHGTDRSAQILIFILFINLLSSFHYRRFNNDDLLFTYLTLGIIISLKSFYFLYFIFFIPFFLFIFKKKKKIFATFNEIFINKYFLYLCILIFSVLTVNISNTGCWLYPVAYTCFENLQWSLPFESVMKMNNWYELWSKAGANPNFRVSNPEEYILNFNWVDTWVNKYFFNKVSDFLFGIIFLIFIFFIVFIRHKRVNKKIDISKLNLLTYLILILILLEWFYNHPALRYGGYCVLALLIFIPFSFYLDQINVSHKNFTKIALILVIISFSIFEIRNYTRILNEIEKYDYKPLNETFYSIDKKYFKIQKRIENLKNNNGLFSKTIF